MGDHRDGARNIQACLIQPPWSLAGDTNKEGGRWYGQAKATKRGRMAGGSLSTDIVPGSPANPTRGEPEEEGPCREYGAVGGNTGDALKSGNVYTKQQRIAELAKLMVDAGFTSLAYLIDLEWLREAYRRTRKDGAAGVDEVTAEEYEKDLEGNLQSLLDRFKSGRYHAPPVKRAYIPKGDGAMRPIGIPPWRIRSCSGRW